MIEKKENLEPEQSINNIAIVREKILDSLLVAIAIFSLFPLIASLYRIKEIGWQHVMLFQILAYMVLSFTAISRRKMTFARKATLLILVAYGLGCIAIFNMGIIGSGMILLLFAVILTTMFFGTSQASVLIMVSFVFLFLTAFSVKQNLLIFTFDIESAALSFPLWLSKLFGFTLFSAVLISSLGKLINILVENGEVLNERTLQLKTINKKLLEKIAEKEIAEEELRKSEEKYRLLAENATDVIWTADLDLKLTYISPSSARFRGFTPQESLNHRPEERITRKSLSKVRKALLEELAIEKKDRKDLHRYRTLELASICKDGSTKWTETKVTFIRDVKGKATGLLGVSRDITNRKALDKQIRLMQHWIENSINPFFWVQEDSQVRYANQAGCRFLGYSLEELCTMKVGDFDLEITHDVWPEFVQLLKDKGSYIFESRLKTKNGEIFPVEITANTLKFENKDYFFRTSSISVPGLERKMIAKRLRTSCFMPKKWRPSVLWPAVSHTTSITFYQGSLAIRSSPKMMF